MSSKCTKKFVQPEGRDIHKINLGDDVIEGLAGSFTPTISTTRIAALTVEELLQRAKLTKRIAFPKSKTDFDARMELIHHSHPHLCACLDRVRRPNFKETSRSDIAEWKIVKTREHEDCQCLKVGERGSNIKATNPLSMA